jgi:hypothetical protein
MELLSLLLVLTLANANQEITQHLSQLCSSICLHELKSDEVCTQFCSFVPHIEANHGEMLRKLDAMLDSHRSVLEYAMRDTVQQRKRNLDAGDDHEAALFYVKQAYDWFDKRSKHEEL